MVIDAIRCYHCGEFVRRNIQFDENGVPFWCCPECGAITEDYRWFKYVTQEEATEIVEHRGRRGRFVLEDGAAFIGIDNTTGDAWVEEFPDLLECMIRLCGDKEDRNE